MQTLNLCHAQSNSAEHFAGDFPFIRRKEDAVAFFDL
jgi:hypothetical protein